MIELPETAILKYNSLSGLLNMNGRLVPSGESRIHGMQTWRAFWSIKRRCSDRVHWKFGKGILIGGRSFLTAVVTVRMNAVLWIGFVKNLAISLES